MKKIFGFIGSPLKEKSNTYTLTKMMAECLVEKDKNIKYEILTAGHVKLNFCTGCWSCMAKGFCPQDKKDDMGMLKEKMLETDFIIFGSPVYTHHISGQTKTFLDRLAAWYHTIRLAGKPGLTVCTTASTGQDIVHEYLSMLMACLGVKTLKGLDTIGYLPGMFRDREEAKKKASETAEIIYPYVTGEKLTQSDKGMEECFQVMKGKSIGGAKWLPADYEYWKENGMLELNSYAELLEKIRK